MKEFLNPTKSKLIKTIIFTILISIVIFLFISSNTGVCLAIECLTVAEAALGGTLLFLPIVLIISYLIFCLIEVKKK